MSSGPTPSPSPDVTLAAVGASPNANGASLAGQVLNLQPASGTQPGVVTTGTQTFAGLKTLSDKLTLTPGTVDSGVAAGGNGFVFNYVNGVANSSNFPLIVRNGGVDAFWLRGDGQAEFFGGIRVLSSLIYGPSSAWSLDGSGLTATSSSQRVDLNQAQAGQDLVIKTARTMSAANMAVRVGSTLADGSVNAASILFMVGNALTSTNDSGTQRFLVYGDGSAQVNKQLNVQTTVNARLQVRSPGIAYTALVADESQTTGAFGLWLSGGVFATVAASHYMPEDGGSGDDFLNFGRGYSTLASSNAFTNSKVYNATSGYKKLARFVCSFTPASGTGRFAAQELLPTINGTSSGVATAQAIGVITDTLTGGERCFVDWGTTTTDYGTGFTRKYAVDTLGQVKQYGSDSSASPGNATIDKPIGISALANGATTCKVTNNLASTAKHIIFSLLSDAGTQTKAPWITRQSDGFTLNLVLDPGANVTWAWELKSIA